MSERSILTGNEACVLGALAAGMDFFAGYPITPATEIAELASRLLPERTAAFIQMEDEIGSICSVIGAAFSGARAMTATSGPGFSLMQEGIGYAMMTELPCVIIDVMRQGPSTGAPTAPAQGDIMQAAFGAHGDYPSIVLAPNSVEELYYSTIRAFELASAYRMPVILLSDATLAHMSESVTLKSGAAEDCWAKASPKSSGDRKYTSGLFFAPKARKTDSAAFIEQRIHFLMSKVSDNEELIADWEEYYTEDAEILIVSFGIASRCAQAAVEVARRTGLKVGLFRLKTLWPLPKRRLRQLSESVKRIICCEMNEGQLALLCRACLSVEISELKQNNGSLFNINTILNAINAVYGGPSIE